MGNISELSQILNRIRQKLYFVANGTGNGLSLLKRDKKLHLSSQHKYPAAAALPIPPNIDAAESTRFSPQRSRDISATAIISHQSAKPMANLDITLDSSNSDPHVDSYDCFGAVSLNSAMQSNVPCPLGGLHKFTHLNMPGGQWSQENKFMSHDLQSSHYMNLRREARAGWSNYDQDAKNGKGMIVLSLVGRFDCQPTNLHEQIRMFSTSKETGKNLVSDDNIKGKDIQKLSKKEQFKKAIKEYGATVIVFHIGISLISLGSFYILVNSGVKLVPFIQFLGLGTESLSEKLVAETSTFVVAYIIHKIFAPVRISITLGATPFIVRYLRAKGVLKKN